MIEQYRTRCPGKVGGSWGNRQNIYNNYTKEKMGNLKKSFITVMAVLASAFLNNCGNDTLKDGRDGKRYRTVKLGKQTWMAENLAYRSVDGCWAYQDAPRYERESWGYQKDEGYVKRYGYLYDWAAACESCPSGWRLPSKEDYDDLFSFLGWDKRALFYKKGYNAQKGGWRYGDDLYTDMGVTASYWTSSDRDAETAYYWGSDVINITNISLKSSGKSVRCIKIEE